MCIKYRALINKTMNNNIVEDDILNKLSET